MNQQKLRSSLKVLFGSSLLLPSLLACQSGTTEQAKTDKDSLQNKKQTPPNVILIYTDDNAFTYWGFGGGPKLSPHIDNIKAQGVEATQFYCTSTVSTPSRYSLHTGRYAGRCQHESFLSEFPMDQSYCITWNTPIDAEKETTMGELFQQGGYTTGYVGKWHLGFDHFSYGLNADDDPSDTEVDKKLKKMQQDVIEHIKATGYDYAASITPSNNDHHPVTALQVHNLEWYAKGTIDFLQQASKQEKPFFVTVNITTHHGPCHIASINSDIRYTQAGIVEGLEGIMPARDSIATRIEAKGYPVDFKTAGTVWTDDCVGAILQEVDRLGMSENTAVIFTTDHNRYDGKGTCYQGGVHIPFVMQLPGVIKTGSQCKQRFQMTDILPTLMELCQIDLPESLDIDGISVWKALAGQADQSPKHEDLYFEFGYTRAVLHGDYKYIALRYGDEELEDMKNGKVDEAYSYKGKTGDEPTVKRYPHYFDADQLYNIKEDPDEQHNLAYDPAYKDKLAEMKQRLKAHTESFDHPFPIDNVDEFYFSDKFKSLSEKARILDMDQYYWYRKGCY